MVRSTDSLDMIIPIDWDVKPHTKQKEHGRKVPKSYVLAHMPIYPNYLEIHN